jgi:hypothetical protein
MPTAMVATVASASIVFFMGIPSRSGRADLPTTCDDELTKRVPRAQIVGVPNCRNFVERRVTPYFEKGPDVLPNPGLFFTLLRDFARFD